MDEYGGLINPDQEVVLAYDTNVKMRVDPFPMSCSPQDSQAANESKVSIYYSSNMVAH